MRMADITTFHLVRGGGGHKVYAWFATTVSLSILLPTYKESGNLFHVMRLFSRTQTYSKSHSDMATHTQSDYIQHMRYHHLMSLA